jgi:hypothetical protein
MKNIDIFVHSLQVSFNGWFSLKEETLFKLELTGIVPTRVPRSIGSLAQKQSINIKILTAILTVNC